MHGIARLATASLRKTAGQTLGRRGTAEPSQNCHKARHDRECWGASEFRKDRGSMTILPASVASSRPRLPTADLKAAAGIAVVAAAICVAVLAADQWWGIDHYDLVRDPNAIASNPNYFGLVSNLGIVLWMVGAVGALQAHAALKGRPGGRFGDVLLVGGAFAAVMGLDDLFMLHESIATFGIPEIVVLVPHALLLLALCYQAWLLRSATPWLLLACGVGGFGLSMAVDVYPVDFGGQVFIEESFKLLGIMFLTVYLVLTSQKALRA